MSVYDCHVHTAFSFDGKAKLSEHCERAVALGLSGFAVTEHNDYAAAGFSHGDHVRASIAEVNRLKEQYEKQVKIFCGVEVADIFLGSYDNTPFYEMKDIDILLGSVHTSALIRKYFPESPVYTLVGNGRNVTKDFGRRLMEQYLLEVLKTAEKAEVDVIAHLTYPLRYLNGDGALGLDISEFSPILDQIFSAIIKRDLSLEVNTSGYFKGWQEFMPPEALLARYYALGGRNITMGSDAHQAEALAVGIPEAKQMLKSIGFTHGSFYQNRKRQSYLL